MTGYYTIGIRYETDSGEPCDPPPHIMERLFSVMQALHEVGWCVEVVYGRAEKNLLDGIDEGFNDGR